MSRPINPEHLYEDELAEEFAIRNIVEKGEPGWAKLNLILASEHSGVLPKPKALPTIRQASEMRACVNKVRDLSARIQEGMRESDDSVLSVLHSRFLHLQDRVNRLHPVAKNYDGIDVLVSDVEKLAFLLDDAVKSIGSPEALSGRDSELEGATNFVEDNDLVPTSFATVMTTSVQPSFVPPPSYNSVFAVSTSKSPPNFQQPNVVNDFVSNAVRDSTNFDFVPPPNSDAGIIAVMQKHRYPISFLEPNPVVNQQQGAISKDNTTLNRPISGKNMVPRSQNAQNFVSTHTTDVSTRSNIRNNSNMYATSFQSFGNTHQSMSYREPLRNGCYIPTAAAPQQSYRSSLPPQTQSFGDSHNSQQQSRFQHVLPPQQPFSVYDSQFSQRYGEDFDAQGAYLPQNSIPRMDAVPLFQHNRANPLLDNNANGRPGPMYHMGKWNLQFCGANSDLPVDEFLFRIETLARSSNIDEDMLPFGMHYVLHGEAQSWYWIYHRDNPQVNWNVFKDALRRHFSLVETQVEIREKISKRKQRVGEAFNEFYLVVAGIASRLNHRMPENELVEILRANMIPPLKSALLFQQTHTVAQLQECCKKCERLWQTESLSANRISRTTLPPRVNEITAHMENVSIGEYQVEPQIFYNANDNQYGYVDQIDALQKPDDKKIANRMDLMICWNCDEMGHTFDLCTVATRNIFCYGCGLKNTYKPTCTRCNAGNSQRAGVNQGPLRPNHRAPNLFLKR